MPEKIEDKLHVLKEYFGHSQFRDNQTEIIDSLLAHRDCLAVMPTGAGKSICFQLPALMFQGITIVISPLISLMNDQIRALRQNGIPAAFLNSSQAGGEQREILSQAQNGQYKLLYVAPERLDAPDFLEYAKNTEISMVTIDEAHCISQWGQDFRPSYSKITAFIGQLKMRPVVSAFTATATQRVREDILASLKLNDPKFVVASFDRKNLFFEVKTPKDKTKTLLEMLAKRPNDYGIVYCSTRKAVDEVAAKLNEQGIKAAPYHAGLAQGERTQNQADFLYDRINVIVATNAFGMGIDKSNVAYVVHYNMPKDIESYYQEAGRAGRDGSRAECTLLFSGQDIMTNQWLIENGSDREQEPIEEAVKEELKAKAKERLRVMETYCKTNLCLRAYILNYFGEAHDKDAHCGECGNCNSESEVVDITILSQKILSCIYKTGQRVGRGLIIDTLRGSKSAKVLQWRFDLLSTYNICTESEREITEVFDFLVENGYIQLAGDQYPIYKLGAKSAEILYQRKPLAMKQNVVAKAERIEKENAKLQRERKSRDAVVYNINSALLEQLKALRRQLADAQNVPAFVIFPDTSLVDMCRILPRTAEEFLNVAGVGAHKQQQYAAAFTHIINTFLAEHSVEKADEALTDSKPDLSDIDTGDEPVPVSVLADKINVERMNHRLKPITAKKLNDFLVEDGLLMNIIDENGKNARAITETGKAKGIIAVERTLEDGKRYFTPFYPPEVQAYILMRVMNYEL
ncbi:ATP-dependent DNA helicase RecQ [Candidatus Symbiothrix dinenymphae]|nr:ATP-dependent DNA helicase RecQ [Candidatus Symbiothrix dinenymphae]